VIGDAMAGPSLAAGRSMTSLFRRIAVAVVAGLLVLGAVIGWRSRAAARYAAAKERVTDACRTYRSMPQHVRSSVCRGHDEFGPRATDIHRRGEASLAEAQASFAIGAQAAGERALTRTLAAVDDLAGVDNLLSAILAAKLVDQVLDLLASHPELDAHVLLERAALESARRPFDGQRLSHLWFLAHAEEYSETFTLGRGALADAIEEDDVVYREMDAALLAGDVPGCEQAGQRLGRAIGGASGLTAFSCAKLVDVVRTGRRLDHARRAAP
jgi:hypothetical protein